MSMNISYTDHGTVKVTCDGVTSEIPLVPPAASFATTASAIRQRLAYPSITQASPNWPTPKDGPAVMIVAPSEGASGSPADTLYSFVQGDTEQLHANLADLKAVPAEELLAHLRGQQAYPSSDDPGNRTTVLNVYCEPQELKAGINTEEFRSLLGTGAQEANAVRLMLKD